MDFTWTAAEEAFRQEIQAFLQAELPAGWGITQFWDPDDRNGLEPAASRTVSTGAVRRFPPGFSQSILAIDYIVNISYHGRYGTHI
jgi:hypothetical protein